MPRHLRFAAAPVVLACCALVARPVGAQPDDRRGRVEVPADRQAEAYYEFLRGRLLNGRGEADAAVEAYRRAAELDPNSAEIWGELAELFAQRNEAQQAVDAAHAALRIDPDNIQGHWVLGTIYATFAEHGLDPPAGVDRPYSELAIEHLEGARDERVYNPGLDVRLGRLYLLTGRYDEAIESLSSFIQTTSASSDVVLMLAQAYEGAGRPDDAIRTLEAAVEADGDFWRGLSKLAELYEQAERWGDAIPVYERLAARTSATSETKARFGRALLNGGQPARAATVLAPLVEADPENGTLAYLLARAQLDANDFEAAERTAAALIDSEPEDIRGLLALAQVYQRRREPARTVNLLQPEIQAARSRNASPSEVAALATHLGFAYLDLERYDAAIATFRDAQQASPPDATLDVYLVQAYLSGKRYAQALEHARRAREQFPADVRLAQLEAQALHRSGQTERGIDLLRDTLRRHPEDLDAHLALAGLYAETRRFEDAAVLLREAQNVFPGNLSVTFQLGAVLEQQRRFGDAERAFRVVLAQDPSHAGALNYLGYMLAEQGVRLDESVSLIQRALEIDPFNGSYLDSLGWAYFKQNRLEEAEENLVRAGEQLKSNSVVQDHLGEVLFRLGRYDEAVEAWQRALNGDGESVERNEIERKIREAREQLDQRRR